MTLDLQSLADKFCEENYLELSMPIQRPKILAAMRISSEATSRALVEDLAATLKEIQDMRAKGDKPQ